jgi:hypothetical protein
LASVSLRVSSVPLSRLYQQPLASTASVGVTSLFSLAVSQSSVSLIVSLWSSADSKRQSAGTSLAHLLCLCLATASAVASSDTASSTSSSISHSSSSSSIFLVSSSVLSLCASRLVRLARLSGSPLSLGAFLVLSVAGFPASWLFSSEFVSSSLVGRFFGSSSVLWCSLIYSLMLL